MMALQINPIVSGLLLTMWFGVMLHTILLLVGIIAAKRLKRKHKNQLSQALLALRQRYQLPHYEQAAHYVDSCYELREKSVQMKASVDALLDRGNEIAAMQLLARQEKTEKAARACTAESLLEVVIWQKKQEAKKQNIHLDLRIENKGIWLSWLHAAPAISIKLEDDANEINSRAFTYDELQLAVSMSIGFMLEQAIRSEQQNRQRYQNAGFFAQQLELRQPFIQLICKGDADQLEIHCSNIWDEGCWLEWQMPHGYDIHLLEKDKQRNAESVALVRQAVQPYGGTAEWNSDEWRNEWRVILKRDQFNTIITV